MNLTDRFPRDDADFEGADNLLRVAWSDSGRRFWIHARKKSVEVFGSRVPRFLAQPLAQFIRSGWSIGQPLEQGAQVKPGAGRENRQSCPTAQAVEDVDCLPPVIAGREYLVRLDEVDQMVGNATLFGRRNFRGADVEMAVDLGRVAGQDFAAKLLRQANSERGFAGSRRP